MRRALKDTLLSSKWTVYHVLTSQEVQFSVCSTQEDSLVCFANQEVTLAHIFAYQEGTLACVFASQKGNLAHVFASQKGTLAQVFATQKGSCILPTMF